MEKQKSTNPGVQQIIDILRPYRTEAIADYTSLNRIMEFVTRIEKRSRSEKIKHDIKLIRALMKPMMITAEEREQQDIIAGRHWFGPHYKRDMDDWMNE
jgi:hypothetical protein